MAQERPTATEQRPVHGPVAAGDHDSQGKEHWAAAQLAPRRVVGRALLGDFPVLGILPEVVVPDWVSFLWGRWRALVHATLLSRELPHDFFFAPRAFYGYMPMAFFHERV